MHNGRFPEHDGDAARLQSLAHGVVDRDVAAVANALHHQRVVIVEQVGTCQTQFRFEFNA